MTCRLVALLVVAIAALVTWAHRSGHDIQRPIPVDPGQVGRDWARAGAPAEASAASAQASRASTSTS